MFQTLHRRNTDCHAGGRRRARIAVAGVLVWALGAGVAPAQDWRAEREEAAAVLVEELHELAMWANTERLFGTRNRLFHLMLRFDPEQLDARRFLRHHRQSDGSWKAPDDAKELQDRKDKKAQAEFFPLEREAIQPFCERMMAIVEREGFSPFAGEGRALVDDVLAVDPDNAAARALRRETWVDGWWQLDETAGAKDRRVAMQALAERALEEAEGLVTLEPVNLEESQLGMPWKKAAVTRYARVVGTTSQEEVRATAAANHAAWQFASMVFGVRSFPYRPYTVYLLEEPQKFEFLDRHPDVSDEMRGFMRGLVGTGIPGKGHVARWDADADHRLDGTVRHTTGQFLSRVYGIGTDHGWVWEGMGLYLSRRLIGTRYTWYVNTAGWTQNAKDNLLRARLVASDTNWMNEAYQVLQDQSVPPLREVVGRNVDHLGGDELLFAYVLSAYLLESWPDEVDGILKRIGRGRQASDRVLEEVTGFDMESLQQRLALWLSQRVRDRDGKVVPEDPEAEVEEPRHEIELTPGGMEAILATVQALDSETLARLSTQAVEAALASGAPQVELVAEWAGRFEGSIEDLPLARQFEAHDAKRFKGGPPRRNIGPGHRLYGPFAAGLPEREPDPFVRRVEYSFPERTIVARRPEGPPSRLLLQNLLQGILPDQDLAEAVLIAALDEPGPLANEAFYFAHLYCDREANAYEGITLYDAWANELPLEVPDPDARAYAILVWDDDSVPVPLSDADHEFWYPRMGESLKNLRRHMGTTRALASLWFRGTPELEAGYGNSRDILHALLALEREDSEDLAELLDEHRGVLLEASLRRVQQEGEKAWNRGNERRDELARGEALIRRAVLEVLEAEGLLDV